MTPTQGTSGVLGCVKCVKLENVYVFVGMYIYVNIYSCKCRVYVGCMKCRIRECIRVCRYVYICKYIFT